MTDTTPSPAPLRFALVSADMTPQMVDAYHDNVDSEGPQTLWWRIVEASPGNDLLQRIVRARDNLQSVRNCRGSEACDVMDAAGLLTDVLNELGGGHG